MGSPKLGKAEIRFFCGLKFPVFIEVGLRSLWVFCTPRSGSPFLLTFEVLETEDKG